MLRRFQVSHNKSLDGVLDQLNSRWGLRGLRGLLGAAAGGCCWGLLLGLPGAAAGVEGAFSCAKRRMVGVRRACLGSPAARRRPPADLHPCPTSCGPCLAPPALPCALPCALLRRHMTDAGPLELIDDEESDADDLLPPTLAGGAAGESGLPGTGGRRAPAIRTRHVALSPTGRAWAAATTEGLLLYRWGRPGLGGLAASLPDAAAAVRGCCWCHVREAPCIAARLPGQPTLSLKSPPPFHPPGYPPAFYACQRGRHPGV